MIHLLKVKTSLFPISAEQARGIRGHIPSCLVNNVPAFNETFLVFKIFCFVFILFIFYLFSFCSQFHKVIFSLYTYTYINFHLGKVEIQDTET